MINKYLILLILAIGIFIGNYWIISSIIPALVINFILYITIKYAETNYHPIVKNNLLHRDLKDLNNNIIINIIAFSSKLSLAASIIYIIYLFYLKFFGTLS